MGIGGEKVAGTPYIVTRGVVLRETETRDADKILTVLTAEQGKIAVIARGARRKSCKFAACAQPLAYSEWTLYKKGDWYYANEGTTLDLFAGLRTDLAAMALGFYFAELTEAVATEDAPHQELLSHLLNGLYAISVLHKPLPLVKAAFELKLLCLAGYAPLADTCAYCGRQDPEQPFFDVLDGVLRCGTCGGGERRGLPLCPAHCLRRCQAAVFLDAGVGGPEAAVRRGGGIPRRAVGAGLQNVGLLQERAGYGISEN